MKALGAAPGRLAEVVISQALWTVGAAMAVALGLAFALAEVLGLTSGNVSVALEPGSIIRVAVGALILAALGAIAPLLKVWRVDPMTVFRS